jgi:type I restriction enzyme R subunit
MTDLPFCFFDSDAEVAVTERRLPHWAQAGTLCFITCRTWDSIPEGVAQAWARDRSAWLARNEIDPLDEGWQDRVRRLPAAIRAEFYRLFSGRWHDMLDNCHGSCPLRRPELSAIVASSLRHFDGDRYQLTDFVIMPNHLHLLTVFPDEKRMLDQCEGWKHYTAVQLNRALGRAGRFWQTDGFDHLVRSAEQFEALRRYIAENPARAGLKAGEFVHYSAALDQVGGSQNG